MDEEVRIDEYNCHGGSSSGGDEDRVLAWEDGLPEFDDLPPLYRHLIPPELASAFHITTGPSRMTDVDVNRASNNTVTSFHHQVPSFNDNSLKSFTGEVIEEVLMDPSPDGLDSRKIGQIEVPVEEAVSVSRNDCYSNNNHDPDISAFDDDFGGAKTAKRPRMVWTAQLHKRFVDVVTHVGIKNSVPKTIMQMMNVEGLTRENVASHLQKYRLYLKRMQGSSDEGPSASDHLFESAPLPQSLQESGGGRRSATTNENGHQGQHQYSGNGYMGLQILFPYSQLPPPHMMHMPMVAMAGQGGVGPGYQGYEAHHHQYGMWHNVGSVHQNQHHVPANGK